MQFFFLNIKYSMYLPITITCMGGLLKNYYAFPYPELFHAWFRAEARLPWILFDRVL